MILRLIIIAVLVGGCNSKKVLDESQYVAGDTTDQLARAHSLIDKNNYKEALVQLYALGHGSLSHEESQWVRDEIVRIYNIERDYEALITYLESREHVNNLTSAEKCNNLYDKAEAYHHQSYNYWARTLGMGSPYRRSKAAFKAKKYYKEFLSQYPNDPRCSDIQKELIGLESYIDRYTKELKEYQAYRSKS